MNLEQAEAYFSELGKKLPVHTVIVLTGGIAAGILADARTTDDIDFALIKPLTEHWDEVSELLHQMAKKHGIDIYFSEDMDRWGSVTLLDWKKHTTMHRKSGSLDIRVLDPLYFTIGKISRGTLRDVQDIEAVLKAQKVDWKPLVKLWAKALKKSPRSAALPRAKNQMEGFLNQSGQDIWGKTFDANEAIAVFRAALQNQK
jgi:hypothetical protein